MLDTKTVSKYYLAEAVQEAIDLAKEGYTVNEHNTYKYGTILQISMEKVLSDEEAGIVEAEQLADWASTSEAIAALLEDPAEETPEEEKVNLDDMGIDELKAFAKEADIKIHHKMTDMTKIKEKILKELVNE